MIENNHKADFSTNRRMLATALLAAIIGICATGGAWLLIKLIAFFTNLFFFHSISFAARSPAQHALGAVVIAIPAVGGLLVGLIARFGSEAIRGHGIPEAIEAILFRKSKISPRVALLKPIASGITIGSGGPFGAEGPIIMTGGAIGSLIAQHVRLSSAERKTLLVAGATAGMTAIFGTPLAAVLLAVELLLFEWRPRSFLPVVTACVMAALCRPMVISAVPMFPMTTAAASMIDLTGCIVCGLLCGALVGALSWTLYRVEDGFAHSRLHWMWWPLLGGVVIGIGGYLQPRALGVGYDVIDDLLRGHLATDAATQLLVVKAIIWTIALGSGTSGGVLAPVLMLGAGLGLVLSPALPGSDALLWPLVCMAAMLAGVLNAPLTAVAFTLELTQDLNALLPTLITTSVAYGFLVLTQRRSIMTEKIARRGLHTFREYAVDALESTHAGDTMTRHPDVITHDETITMVRAQYFGAQQRRRAFPVVDGSDRLLGMVDRDSFRGSGDAEDARPIGDLLGAAAPVFALETETCRIVAGRMTVNGLERLPVVADAASLKLTGIISRSDLIRAQANFDDEHRERLRSLRMTLRFIRRR